MKTKRIDGKVMSIDVLNKRINNLVEMRPFDDGSMKSTIAYEDCNIHCNLNGASAWLLVEPNFALGARESKKYYVTELIRPLANSVSFPSQIDGVSLGLHTNDELPFLYFYNNNNFEVTVDVPFAGDYPLAHMVNPEVTDARVGYNGKLYETAGEAIREQIEDVIGYSEVLCVRTLIDRFDNESSATVGAAEILEHIDNGGAVVLINYNGTKYAQLAERDGDSVTFVREEIVDGIVTQYEYVIDNEKNVTTKIYLVESDPNFQGENIVCSGVVLSDADENIVTMHKGDGDAIVLDGMSGEGVTIENVASGVNDTDAVNVAQLNETVGDIESSLDAILEIQHSLIGGDFV